MKTISIFTLCLGMIWNPINVQIVDMPVLACEQPVQQIYLDIPMSKNLQNYTMKLSNEYNVPFELIVAVIDLESAFQTNVVSSTNDYGLMQINKINHTYLKTLYRFEDILNPYNNILAGTHILSNLYNKYDGNVHKTLMAYNLGETGAKRYWNEGIYETNYSKGGLERFEKYKTYRGATGDSREKS